LGRYWLSPAVPHRISERSALPVATERRSRRAPCRGNAKAVIICGAVFRRDMRWRRGAVGGDSARLRDGKRQVQIIAMHMAERNDHLYSQHEQHEACRRPIISIGTIYCLNSGRAWFGRAATPKVAIVML
jgi:hypothetical protein